MNVRHRALLLLALLIIVVPPAYAAQDTPDADTTLGVQDFLDQHPGVLKQYQEDGRVPPILSKPAACIMASVRTCC
ncbi:MAG: hypothetical protein HC893_14395 [Chloroflexaceae bacterium]|nr:hypothetical protein [Chloroflexaceae bacterium]